MVEPYNLSFGEVEVHICIDLNLILGESLDDDGLTVEGAIDDLLVAQIFECNDGGPDRRCGRTNCCLVKVGQPVGRCMDLQMFRPDTHFNDVTHSIFHCAGNGSADWYMMITGYPECVLTQSRSEE